MEPIKNAGAVDYAIALPQNQNQIQEYDDYASMPIAYDPEMEQKKKASSNMVGLTALGLLAAGGIGVGIWKHKQVKGLKNEISELKTINEDLGTKLDAAKKEIENLTTKKPEEKEKNIFKRIKKWWNNRKADKADKADKTTKPDDTTKPDGSK